MEWLRKIHHRLLPNRRDVGWIPYVWLAYLTAFILPWRMGSFSVMEHGLHAVGLALFLFLYFKGYWVRGRSLALVMGIMTCIGLVLSPINSGSIVFYIYACAYAGRFHTVKAGAISLALILVVMVPYLKMLDIHWATIFFGTTMSAIVGVINIYYSEMEKKDQLLRLSQEEVRHLAIVAERERIARDLHDLLGHTLSVIALKSELASRLMDRDQEQAAREIRDVEAISRKALRQVRDAVSGYRDSGLEAEVANARRALEVLGIDFQYDTPCIEFSPKIEAVFAMVLREAVTNMIRHSQATSCSIGFSVRDSLVEMTIEDNGKCGPIQEGSGISGMRDRLRIIGGWLGVDIRDGMCLKVTAPLEVLACEG